MEYTQAWIWSPRLTLAQLLQLVSHEPALHVSPRLAPHSQIPRAALFYFNKADSREAPSTELPGCRNVLCLPCPIWRPPATGGYRVLKMWYN